MHLMLRLVVMLLSLSTSTTLYIPQSPYEEFFAIPSDYHDLTIIAQAHPRALRHCTCVGLAPVQYATNIVYALGRHHWVEKKCTICS